MPGGSFSCQSLGGATATWWLEARNAATHSTAAATAKRYRPRKSTVPQLRDPGSTQRGLRHALSPLGPCTHRSLCMWIIFRVSRKMSFPWRPSLTLKSGVGVLWHIYVKPSPVIALITLHDDCFADLPLTILRTATCVCVISISIFPVTCSVPSTLRAQYSFLKWMNKGRQRIHVPLR